MSFKLVIFDLDQTLRGETLFDDAEYVIKELAKNDMRMAVASFNKYADWLCGRYGIDKHFDIICGYYDERGKITHINQIKEHYKSRNININDTDIIFFDDDEHNINNVRNNSDITCVKVDPSIGLQRDLLQKLQKKTGSKIHGYPKSGIEV